MDSSKNKSNSKKDSFLDAARIALEIKAENKMHDSNNKVEVKKNQNESVKIFEKKTVVKNINSKKTKSSSSKKNKKNFKNKMKTYPVKSKKKNKNSNVNKNKFKSKSYSEKIIKDISIPVVVSEKKEVIVEDNVSNETSLLNKNGSKSDFVTVENQFNDNKIYNEKEVEKPFLSPKNDGLIELFGGGLIILIGIEVLIILILFIIWII